MSTPRPSYSMRPDPPLPPKTWTRRDPGTKVVYLISTRREYLSLAFINDAFSSPDMSWARRMPEPHLESMLDNSLTLGLYTTEPRPAADTEEDSSTATPSIYSHLRQIGMARLITDYTTLAYLTDVYVLPSHRGKGHAAWLAKCVAECVTNMERGAQGAWRRTLLLTGNPKWAQPFYGKWLGAVSQEENTKHGVEFMTTMPKGEDKHSGEEGLGENRDT